MPHGSWAATISLVQKQAANTVIGNTRSITFTSPNTAGNAIVLFAYFDDTNGDPAATVSDSSTNAYVSAGVTCISGVDNYCAQIFYAMNITGGTNTTTLRIANVENHIGMQAYEYSGLATHGMFDTSAGQVAPSSTRNATTPSIQTRFPAELLFAGFIDANGSGTITAGSGWTMQLTDTIYYGGSEDQIVSTIGTYQDTATLVNSDNQWVGVIATFKAAGEGNEVSSRSDHGGRLHPFSWWHLRWFGQHACLH